MVVLALIPCLIFGIFNTGYQHEVAFGHLMHPAEGLAFCSGDFWSWTNFVVFGFIKVTSF